MEDGSDLDVNDVVGVDAEAQISIANVTKYIAADTLRELGDFKRMAVQVKHVSWEVIHIAPQGI